MAARQGKQADIVHGRIVGRSGGAGTAPPRDHLMAVGSRLLADDAVGDQQQDGTDHRAIVGHADRSGGGNASWNSAHLTPNCTKQGLIMVGGAGHIYCFAIN